MNEKLEEKKRIEGTRKAAVNALEEDKKKLNQQANVITPSVVD